MKLGRQILTRRLLVAVVAVITVASLATSSSHRPNPPEQLQRLPLLPRSMTTASPPYSRSTAPWKRWQPGLLPPSST